MLLSTYHLEDNQFLLLYLYLHPGIGSSNEDKRLWYAPSASKIGSYNIIVGRNSNFPTSFSVSPTPTQSTNSVRTTSNLSKANFRVSYFMSLYKLISSNKLSKISVSSLDKTPKSYKFLDSFLSMQNSPTSMKPSTSLFNGGDIFYVRPDWVSGKNKLLFGLLKGGDYYNSHLPPRANSTRPIDNTLFGTGFMSNDLNRLPDINGITYSNGDIPNKNTTPSNSLYQAGPTSNALGTINVHKYKPGTSGSGSSITNIFSPAQVDKFSNVS